MCCVCLVSPWLLVLLSAVWDVESQKVDAILCKPIFSHTYIFGGIHFSSYNSNLSEMIMGKV